MGPIAVLLEVNFKTTERVAVEKPVQYTVPSTRVPDRCVMPKSIWQWCGDVYLEGLGCDYQYVDTLM